MNVPKDTSYPSDSVQCDKCGGLGCQVCDDKGWLFPKTNPLGRRCENPGCHNPLHPASTAVYCSKRCASEDF